MEKSKAISPFQLFSVMFISSVFCSTMYSQYMVKNMDLLMYAVSAILAIPALLLITIPLVVFSKHTENENIIKTMQAKKPILSRVYTFVYAHYFIHSAVVSLVIFSLLLSNFINPGISFFAFFALTLICCYYAAFKGLTSIARSSTIFFAVTVLALVFICLSLTFKINMLNYSEVFLEDGSGIFENILPLVALSSSVPAVFLFVHRIKGGIKKPLYTWIVISNIAVFFISLVSFGVLGDFLYLTPFPFYTATQLTEIGAFQRLDVVFLALWTIGMFINVTLSLYALRETIQTSFRAERVKYLNPLSVVLIGIYSLIAVSWNTLRSYLFNSKIMLVFFIITALVLPIIALLVTRIWRINPKKAKTATAAILTILIIPIMTGCENVQLYERLLIKGIGIDKTEEGYSVTVQYLDNYSEEEGQRNKFIKVTGDTIGDAMGNIKNFSGSEPFLGQNVAIVVGFETAKENMDATLDYFIHYCDSRPTVKLYISETTAEDILTFEESGELVPIDNLSNLTISKLSDNNLFTLLNFMNQSKNPMDTPTASLLAIKNNSITLSSVAVFGGERGLYKLDKDQLAAFKTVNAVAQGSVLSFDDISCEIIDCTSRIDAEDRNGILNFKVYVDLSFTVLENPDRKSDEEIESTVRTKLTEKITDSMEETLHENKCDIYNLGRNLRWNDYKIYSNIENYSEKLTECELAVNINCKTVNTIN